MKKRQIGGLLAVGVVSGLAGMSLSPNALHAVGQTGKSQGAPMSGAGQQNSGPGGGLNGGSNNGFDNGEGRGGRPNPANMTPEQRQQMEQQMQARRADQTKQMLTRAGFTDATLQSTVVAFTNAQETSRRGLSEAIRALDETLRNEDATDAEITTALGNLRAAVAAEKTRRVGAEVALNKAINYKSAPKLEALLTARGVIGEEFLVAGAGGPKPGGPGGRRPGGPNGYFNGGPNGGPGGYNSGPSVPPSDNNGDSEGSPAMMN